MTTSPYFGRNEIRYRGTDAEKQFVSSIVKERNRCLKLIKDKSHKKMNLTTQEKIAHEKADKCWVRIFTVLYFLLEYHEPYP